MTVRKRRIHEAKVTRSLDGECECVIVSCLQVGANVFSMRERSRHKTTALSSAAPIMNGSYATHKFYNEEGEGTPRGGVSEVMHHTTTPPMTARGWSWGSGR